METNSLAQAERNRNSNSTNILTNKTARSDYNPFGSVAAAPSRQHHTVRRLNFALLYHAQVVL
jgi:hypothetical protein